VDLKANGVGLSRASFEEAALSAVWRLFLASQRVAGVPVYDVRAQGAIDRVISNNHELVIEGESYRKRLRPKLGSASPEVFASGSQPRQRKQRRSR
jgi:hypothetical protein